MNRELSPDPKWGRIAGAGFEILEI
jgi:hypothetical protein